MTTVSPITGGATPPGQTQPRSPAETAEADTGKTMINSDFETFLVMLTTQLQNQDPLNPMEASDFAVQLATFAGVEQQVKGNDLLGSIQGQLGMMSMSQLSGWIGMEARATAPAYFDGQPVTLMPDPQTGADKAEIVVYNEAGAEVGRHAIAPTDEPVVWGGMQANGTPYPVGLYNFRVESFFGSEKLADTPVDIYAEVVEARTQGGSTVLVLSGGTEIGADAVQALRKPPEDIAA